MIYTRDKPAKSVNEVVLHLLSEHNPNFVYRGQVKDYGTLIPSLYRKTAMVKDGDYFYYRQTFNLPGLKLSGLLLSTYWEVNLGM